MKIMRNFGIIVSAVCTIGMVQIGVDAITQAQASQNLLTLEDQRVNLELEAQRFVNNLGEEQLQCLAQNIFFEARGESIAGQMAVAWVTLNRVDAERYPDTICGVVRQANRDDSGNLIRHQCQFSWYCDGRSDAIPSNAIAQQAWENAQLIAEVVLLDYARGYNNSPVADATMYHADYVDPYWADDYEMVDAIGVHIFYR